MNYYELRNIISKIIPRMTVLQKERRTKDGIQEKGRKAGYHQYNLKDAAWRKQERLLNTEEVSSFVEVSVRAAACPMPLNIDTWDGLICPYACTYCFANAFRATLYTAFFDNSKTMGFRHCNPDYYKRELDKLLAIRGKNPHDVKGEVAKSIAMDVPMRFGIRFEDFLNDERENGVSLQLLNYLADQAYPVMINTKSSLVGEPKYVDALSRNKAGSAVHVTMISSNESLLRKLEPGAPTFKQRLEGVRNLVDAGVRVVARIEPFLPFINDHPDEVKEYMELVWDAGVRNITLDTYSYNAHNPGIREAFVKQGIDFERIFLVGCDSQALGSLLLGKFMGMFQDYGFSCSTFDMGNAAQNDQTVCCEVGDWFKGGFNYGCTVVAARYIREQKGNPVNWQEFSEYVDHHGGFLSDVLKRDVKELWNCEGNNAYSHSWAQGIEPAGWDEDGIIWKFVEQSDFRQDILEGLI